MKKTKTYYNPEILQEFADILYRQASQVTFICVALGVIIGGLVGYGMGNESLGGAIVGAILLAALGYVIGISIAFQLKLRAQLVLCQKQTEENTRKSSVAPSPAPSATPQRVVARPFYFSASGKDSGPHSLDEMRQFRQSGRVTDETLVIRDGDKDWQPATMFPEITF